MGLFDSWRRTPPQPQQPDPPPPSRRSEPAAIRVPEITAGELIPQYDGGTAPMLLDCREPFEWRQLRIPGSLHIPMNEIPSRLAELDREQEWVIVCAHGNRSYAVAGYLIYNGFKATSLAGGVTDWWMHKGATESG